MFEASVLRLIVLLVMWFGLAWFGLGVGLAMLYYSHNTIVVSEVCDFEDGRTDGQPCIWTDPSDGSKHIVDSSEYTR